MDTLCLGADASGPVVESPDLVSRTHGVNKADAAADGNYHHHLPKSEKEIFIFDCLPPVKSVRSFILFKPIMMLAKIVDGAAGSSAPHIRL